jgi:glycine/D-amino acid oxidase-like deaminating enzyme
VGVLQSRDHAVLVVGGGLTGLMLAGELAVAGVDVAIVERRANQDLTGSRAGGLHRCGCSRYCTKPGRCCSTWERRVASTLLRGLTECSWWIAEYVGAWQLPVIGVISAPTAVLIRPDGYVAWVGDRADEQLTDALTSWFGPPNDEAHRRQVVTVRTRQLDGH